MVVVQLHIAAQLTVGHAQVAIDYGSHGGHQFTTTAFGCSKLVQVELQRRQRAPVEPARQSGRKLASGSVLSSGVCVQVPLNEYEFPTSKVANVQHELQRLIEKNYYLNQSAKDAYRAYVLAYNSHSLKDIFNVHTLDLAAVAKSFGFQVPPRVRFTGTVA